MIKAEKVPMIHQNISRRGRKDRRVLKIFLCALRDLCEKQKNISRRGRKDRRVFKIFLCALRDLCEKQKKYFSQRAQRPQSFKIFLCALRDLCEKQKNPAVNDRHIPQIPVVSLSICTKLHDFFVLIWGDVAGFDDEGF